MRSGIFLRRYSANFLSLNVMHFFVSIVNSMHLGFFLWFWSETGYVSPKISNALEITIKPKICMTFDDSKASIAYPKESSWKSVGDRWSVIGDRWSVSLRIYLHHDHTFSYIAMCGIFFILIGYIVHVYMYQYTCSKFVTNIVMGLKIWSQVGELTSDFQNHHFNMIFLKSC